MHIIHIISSFQVGGLETFAVRLSQLQLERGHTVSIVGFGDGPLRARAERMGIQARAFTHSRRIPRLRSFAQFVLAGATDVIHAHNPTTFHYARLARALSGATVIATYHGQGERSAAVSRYLWGTAHRIVAVSEAALQEIPGQVRAKARVIRNGVSVGQPLPPSRREAVRSRYATSSEPTGIIVARLERVKQHTVLLHALALLQDRESVAIPMWIVGEGSLRTQLEAAAAALRLTAVRFLGNRDDVRELLGAADFFVLCSSSEGHPLSLLEAMAEGLPVIATAVGGIPEVISDSVNGLLVPSGDEVALAAAIRRVRDSRSLCAALGRQATETIQSSFSLNAMFDEYMRIYNLGRVAAPCI